MNNSLLFVNRSFNAKKNISFQLKIVQVNAKAFAYVKDKTVFRLIDYE